MNNLMFCNWLQSLVVSRATSTSLYHLNIDVICLQSLPSPKILKKCFSIIVKALGIEVHAIDFLNSIEQNVCTVIRKEYVCLILKISLTDSRKNKLLKCFFFK